VIRALVVIAALCGSARADSPRWWQQFYLTAGARDLVGLNATASSAAYGAGYRFERGWWGIDVALVDLQAGLGEGMHTVGRVTGYLDVVRSRFGSLWAGTGASYGFVRGWTTSDVPGRSEHGPQWSVAVGFDSPRAASVAGFVELVADVPLFAARDRYGSMDSSQRVIGVELAVGARF
jgi:hypothetical protein